MGIFSLKSLNRPGELCLASDLYFIPSKGKETRFGTMWEKPDFNQVIQFLGVKKCFWSGAAIYNAMGLSTQVPSHFSFISDKYFKFKLNGSTYESISLDYQEYELLTQEEYNVVESLSEKFLIFSAFPNRSEMIHRIYCYSVQANIDFNKLDKFLTTKSAEIFKYIHCYRSKRAMAIPSGLSDEEIVFLYLTLNRVKKGQLYRKYNDRVYDCMIQKPSRQEVECAYEALFKRVL